MSTEALRDAYTVKAISNTGGERISSVLTHATRQYLVATVFGLTTVALVLSGP